MKMENNSIKGLCNIIKTSNFKIKTVEKVLKSKGWKTDEDYKMLRNPY